MDGEHTAFRSSKKLCIVLHDHFAVLPISKQNVWKNFHPCLSPKALTSTSQQLHNTLQNFFRDTLHIFQPPDWPSIQGPGREGPRSKLLLLSRGSAKVTSYCGAKRVGASCVVLCAACTSKTSTFFSQWLLLMVELPCHACAVLVPP